jgi:hypothetical protein
LKLRRQLVDRSPLPLTLFRNPRRELAASIADYCVAADTGSGSDVPLVDFLTELHRTVCRAPEDTNLPGAHLHADGGGARAAPLRTDSSVSGDVGCTCWLAVLLRQVCEGLVGAASWVPATLPVAF